MSGANEVRELMNAFRGCPCNYSKLRHFLAEIGSEFEFFAAGIWLCCYFELIRPRPGRRCEPRSK
jgi:hypothetical protein